MVRWRRASPPGSRRCWLIHAASSRPCRERRAHHPRHRQFHRCRRGRRAVKPGDLIEVDAPLVTLETDKASMDVPATAAGRITEVLLKRGDKVSKGSLIVRVEAGAGAAAAPATSRAAAPAANAAAAAGTPAAAPPADASARAPRASVRAD